MGGKALDALLHFALELKRPPRHLPAPPGVRLFRAICKEVASMFVRVATRSVWRSA
jgi:hypothetical protein